MVTPRKTMTYKAWLERLQRERAERNREPAGGHLPAHVHRGAEGSGAAPVSTGVPAQNSSAVRVDVTGEPVPLPDPGCREALPSADLGCREAVPSADPGSKADPAFLPAVEFFRAGQRFTVGEIDVNPFTIPHDAADPCGFVFHARREALRMAIVTDLGYVPPNVKLALKDVDVLLLEFNHDLEMLKDGPYPWSVKQRVLSRVGHLSNAAAAEFLLRDYDGGAHTVVLGHLSEQNNLPELARLAAEAAIGDRLSLLGNRVVLAGQDAPLEPICL
jgi:hypothetical protein